MGVEYKILVVEDSSAILNLIRRILGFQSCEISTAKNGQMALQMLSVGNRFNLILMDINMPVMDGVECTANIRKLEDPEQASTSIIAISGNPHGYTLEDFKDLGFTDFMQKPINFDLLVEKVYSLNPNIKKGNLNPVQIQQHRFE